MAYDKLLLLDDVGRTFTAKAAGIISGGDLVEWNSGTDVVGSVATTYAFDDIAVVIYSGAIAHTDAAKNNCLGVAEYTVISGDEVNIIQQGVVILAAGSGGISGGEPVMPSGYASGFVEHWTGSAAVADVRHQFPIGRAYTAATANTGFAIVRLNL